MSTQSTAATQSSARKSGDTTLAEKGAILADLLKSGSLGVKLTGLVSGIEPDRELKGKSGKGADYHFIIRETAVFAGGLPVVIRERWNPGDNPPVKHNLGQPIEMMVKSARMDGAVMQVSGVELDETLS